MNSIKRTKFNVSLLGETQVGKTSMISVKTGIEFDENQLATVGIDNFLDIAKFENQEYKFKIFDTAGQERYNSISSQTLKVADGYILVFAVDKRSSFEKIDLWIKSLEENVNIKKKALILVGNKCDLEKREVTKDEGEKFAQEYHMNYYETSAKTGEGIQEVFNQIYKEIYQLFKKLEENNKNNQDHGKNGNKSIKLNNKKKKISLLLNFSSKNFISNWIFDLGNILIFK